MSPNRKAWPFAPHPRQDDLFVGQQHPSYAEIQQAEKAARARRSKGEALQDQIVRMNAQANARLEEKRYGKAALTRVRSAPPQAPEEVDFCAMELGAAIARAGRFTAAQLGEILSAPVAAVSARTLQKNFHRSSGWK